MNSSVPISKDALLADPVPPDQNPDTNPGPKGDRDGKVEPKKER